MVENVFHLCDECKEWQSPIHVQTYLYIFCMSKPYIVSYQSSFESVTMMTWINLVRWNAAEPGDTRSDEFFTDD